MSNENLNLAQGHIMQGHLPPCQEPTDKGKPALTEHQYDTAWSKQRRHRKFGGNP